MYDSWDMENNRQNFLSPWTIFCPFTPRPSLLTTQKVNTFWEIEKKQTKKKHLEILSFYKSEPYMTIIWCMVSEIWSETDRFFVVLDHFLSFYPLKICKIKILKKWTKSLELLSFYKCIPQMTIIWCMVLEIWNATDRIFCLFGTFFALSFP